MCNVIWPTFFKVNFIQCKEQIQYKITQKEKLWGKEIKKEKKLKNDFFKKNFWVSSIEIQIYHKYIINSKLKQKHKAYFFKNLP